MAEPQWQARIEGALSASFYQPDGSSRPGTDYAVGLKRGEQTHKVSVRAYLAETVSAATRSNTEYQAQTVLDFVFDRLAAGWTPQSGPLPALTILDPSPGQPVAPPRKGPSARLTPSLTHRRLNRLVRSLIYAFGLLCVFVVLQGEFTGEVCFPSYLGSGNHCFPWGWNWFSLAAIPILALIFLSYPIYVWILRLKGVSDEQIYASCVHRRAGCRRSK